MQRSTMFIKMMSSSFRKRKSRVAIALFAIIIGTAVISGLLSVYYDISIKMSKEFRSYGANLIITPGEQAEGNIISQAEVDRVAGMMPEGSLVGYAPYLYGVAQVEEQRLVVVGTWFDQVKKVSPYWKVTGNPTWERNDAGKALIGAAAAKKLELDIGNQLDLKDERTGRTKQVTIQGIVNSGGTEDNQIFISMAEAQELFNQPESVNVAYFSVMSKGQELESQARKIKEKFSNLQARPIKQISQSETVILEKIRSLVYLVISIIFLSTLLCVATTMMTMVVERKREIALKKALGAQNPTLVLEFLSEGGILSLLGSLLGIGLGHLLAQLIGQSVFQSAISFRAAVIPMVILISLIVTGLASFIPVKTVVAVEPAVVLKGE